MTNFLLYQLFASTILSLALCCTPLKTSMRVVTPLGRVSGKIISYRGTLVRAFLGIPYVKPPLGQLRFKRPVPVEPWTITLEAKSLPPGCPQYSPNPFRFVDDLPGLSENCLYLNIWTPLTASRSNKKSVMFWIHGGGFRFSSNRLDYHDGRALAAEGDVIVVSPNYRLGALGFFYSATDDAPGNMGMLDLVEALKWVRTNIESFGGDKNSVTLFGRSSGGIAIGMFCVSPLAKGLFKRVILQSGSSTTLDGEDNHKSFRISQKLAEAVGCADSNTTLKKFPERVVECMKDVDATELASKLSVVTRGMQRGYFPRFGDQLLPKNPRQAAIDGDFDPTDVLIGSDNGDGADLITTSMKDVFGLYGEKNPRINLTFGESIIRNRFKDFPDPDGVVRQYLEGLKEDDYDKIRFEVFTAAGDYSRVCPSVYFAENFSKKSPNVYYYFLTRRPSPSPYAPWMLSVHFDEVIFMFGYPLRYPANYTISEQLLSRQMMQDWSHFAKTGSPLSSLWPRYSKQSPEYQRLDVHTMETGYGPHRANCDFFRPYFGF